MSNVYFRDGYRSNGRDPADDFDPTSYPDAFPALAGRYDETGDTMTENLPAIRSVLAAHRSTEAHVTEEQITAAWTEFDALPASGWLTVDGEQFARLFAELPLAEATITPEGLTQWTFRGGLELQHDGTTLRLRLASLAAAEEGA